MRIILLLLLSTLAYSQEMKFIGEVEQKADTIPNGQNSVTVNYTDTLVTIPKIVVMEASSEVSVTNITKYSCDINSASTDGVTFKLSIINK